MNLFILSHSCVTPTNQEFFAEVERQSGWSLTIAAPARWQGEYGERELERWPGFEGTLLPIPVLGSGNVPLHVYRSFFVSALRSAAPDAIYAHHEPYALATAQLYAANALTTNAPIGFFTWQNIAKTYPLPIRLLERWVYRSSAFACAGSTSATEVLREKGYEGPVTSMPGSVDPERYAPSPKRDRIRQELGIDEDEVLFGFMGRVVEEKGLGTLATALETLNDLPWRLAVVGEGPYAPVLAEQFANSGLRDRLIEVGYVPHSDAPHYLSAFDVLVLPSETQSNWREQFGRVIIEAMACGTPVVGSSSGEIPNLLRKTGGGRIFEEGNPTALATALRTLGTDPDLRRELAEQGRRSVQTEFTDATLADRFIQTIQTASRSHLTPA